MPEKRTAHNRREDPFVIKEGSIKDGKIGPVYRFGWAEEIYNPDAGHFETVGKNFNFAKLPILGVLLLSFLLLLTAKAAWLQVVKGEYYYYLAEGNRIRVERVEPRRGVIYDQNGLTLVRNQANFVLYLVPADLPRDEAELDRLLGEVSAIAGLALSAEIKSRIDGINPRSLEALRPVFIADNIEYEKAMALYLKSAEWPGVGLTNRIRREYLNYIYAGEDGAAPAAPGRYSLSHILGYTGKISEQELARSGQEYTQLDYIGKMGVEYFWENELKGLSGHKQVEVDAIGKEQKVISKTEAEDGHNLVLSLDVYQQVKLEEVLAAHLKRLDLNRAAGIILHPKSGEIRALVSLPAYDNNLFARGISQNDFSALIEDADKPLFNRAVSGEYPSGSVIKPVIAAAALEEGIISEHTSILSTGGLRISQWFFPDWLGGGHGPTSVRKALAQSVNTFFYYIGGGYDEFRGLGADGIVRYGSLFGLGAQTGVDLPGEALGLLPTAEWKKEVKGESWYIGDTYHLSIGQGNLLATPLQIAAYTAVFANGGVLYRPHLVKQILYSDDTPAREIAIEPVRENFLKPYNIEVVRQGLRQAVTQGSARRLASLPVPAAGKTGTAQWSSQESTHAWFAGFAPYDDPEQVIVILVEAGGEGSETAVPIVEEYWRWYFGEYRENF
jgi:penicillin-binding protein 2